MAKVVAGENDLLSWCKNNDKIGEQLLAEWMGTDPDGNSLNIERLGKQSNKYAMWKCSKGHIWKARIQKRTLLGSGCPYCSNQRIKHGENDLETWCKENKPELINEFTGKDVEGNSINMYELTKGTHKKVVWKHLINNEEHTWIASVSDRTYKNSGCPICNNKYIFRPGVNDLDTWCNRDEYGHILKEQWIGLDINGNMLKMSEIAHGSHTKVAWICDCGNMWMATPLSRIYHRSIYCPDCSRQNAQNIKNKALIENGMSLYDWCKQNSLYGKNIIDQWVGIDADNNKVNIHNVTYGSHRKVWWKHIKNNEEHTWLASIHNRVCRHSNCPMCNNKSTSLNEQIIFKVFKQVYDSTLNRVKIDGLEYDIFIPELNLCIEYDGEYYHRNKYSRDEFKKEHCNSKNIQFLRIKSIRDSKNTHNDWDISTGVIVGAFDHKRELLKELVKKVFEYFNIEYSDEMYESAFVEAVLYMQ